MDEKPNKEIAHYVFAGSTTMIGVCITVIALFKVMNNSIKTYADEILGIATLIFIMATFSSYLSLRNDDRKFEQFADYLFFGGLIILLLVGIMIIFTTY
ncbi:MAG: hypothetical protein U0U67_16545 [Chitinophagales bacterium]